jgi:uncharacterized membrane protein (UPF0127 family)
MQNITKQKRKMKKKITINYKRKKIKIIANECNLWKKFLGLMFSRRENAEILLFSFRRKQKIKIHSFFVFFRFVALWLDEKNNVVDIKIVKPFTLSILQKPAYNLIEIPFNKKYKKLINLFTTVDK